ncbi:MAG: phage minor head protein [Nitrososphaerales archaeon]
MNPDQLDANQLTQIYEAIKAMDQPKRFVRYRAIVDPRTTDRCRRLHRKVWLATALPPTFNPPIHFGCRCVIEVFFSTLRNQLRTKGFTKKKDVIGIKTSQPPGVKPRRIPILQLPNR